MPKKRKSYPAVTTLWFPLVQGDRYIDLGQCLSLVNRRMYRQGMKYYVDSFELVAATADASGNAYVDIDCIPNTWMSENAWQKAFAIWNRMNREAIDATASLSSVKPKFHDFKVFFDETHYVQGNTRGSAHNLMPVDAGGTAAAVSNAEWLHSIVVLPNLGGSSAASEYCLKFLGNESGTANATIGVDGSRTLIQSYARTRVSQGSDPEPDLPGDASSDWMTTIFSDGETSSDVINHLEGHNDEPPYATATNVQGGDNPIYIGGSESFSNGQVMCKLRFNMGAQTGPVIGRGGEVLAGLLKVGSNVDTAWLGVHLAPGTYKGVAALPIGV